MKSIGNHEATHHSPSANTEKMMHINATLHTKPRTSRCRENNMFTGIASYARPRTFRLCLQSLARTRIVRGVIVAIDAPNPNHRDQYLQAIEEAKSLGLEVVASVSNERRGSAKARNAVLDLAEQVLRKDDVLVLYDDDYLCPGAHALAPAIPWLRDGSVGLVGGRVINLRRRRIDPDFYLNVMPGLADALTRATGFVFLDTKHGPRLVDYTTPLMAIRVDVISKGVRYDLNYWGTGYREESDFQLQIRKLGYRIVYEPRFYAIHLCLEEGGNRTLNDAVQRFYWKARNNTYFIKKHRLGTWKLITSTAIIAAYAALHGLRALRSVQKGFREGLVAPLSLNRLG